MSQITITIEATDALLAQGALDLRSAAAHRDARHLIEAGRPDSPEYDIALTTAMALDRVSRAIVAELYPEAVAA